MENGIYTTFFSLLELQIKLCYILKAIWIQDESERAYRCSSIEQNHSILFYRGPTNSIAHDCLCP